jgi:nucleotide-binding universal stress UspA family protein
MSYKTILVHVDASRHVAARIDVAAKIAMAQEAHLIGAALTGISRFIEDAVAVNPSDPAIAPYLDTLRKRASECLDRFDEQVRRIGVNSFERRLVDDEASGGISLQARYSDLVVVGQSDPDEAPRALDADFPEYVAVSSGTPVLIVPFAGSFPSTGSHAVIGWNGSREARRAVQDAMPLLQAAQRVEVVVFNPAERPDLHSGDPGADIIRYLHRYGIAAELRAENVKHGEIGSTLLSIAATSSADLLVIGCYGHTRFREMLLGGVTRDVLASMTVPVFMSH